MIKFLAVASLAALALPAFAGESLSDFQCDNMCPLAQEANNHRSYGIEAVNSSEFVRAEITQSVKAKLARI